MKALDYLIKMLLIALIVWIAANALNGMESRIDNRLDALQNDIAEVGLVCMPKFGIYEPLGEHPSMIPWATPTEKIK